MADSSSSPAQNTRSHASPRPPLSSARKEKKDKKRGKSERKTADQDGIDQSSEEEIFEDESFNLSSSSGDTLDGSVRSNLTEVESFMSFIHSPGSDVGKNAKGRAVSSPNKDNVSPERGKYTPRVKTPSPQTTRTQTYTGKKENGYQSGNNTLVFVVGAVIVLVIAICMFNVPSLPDAENPPMKLNQRMELFSSFKQNISFLEKVFNRQSRSLWQTVKGSMRSIIVEEEPSGPAVLLFVIPKDQQNGKKASQCIGQRIVRTLNTLFHRKSLDHLSVISIRDDLSHKEPAKDKAELDNMLIKCFEGRSKGVVIQHLEELAPLATLLLHGYCDGDNAPHKDVVFVLLLNVEKTMVEVTSKKNFADKYLTDLWSSGLDLDRSQPLLSRIANNVVVVTSENSEVLNAEC